MSRRLIIDKATAHRLDCTVSGEWWLPYVHTQGRTSRRSAPVTRASARTAPILTEGLDAIYKDNKTKRDSLLRPQGTEA